MFPVIYPTPIHSLHYDVRHSTWAIGLLNRPWDVLTNHPAAHKHTALATQTSTGSVEEFFREQITTSPTPFLIRELRARFLAAVCGRSCLNSARKKRGGTCTHMYNGSGGSRGGADTGSFQRSAGAENICQKAARSI